MLDGLRAMDMMVLAFSVSGILRDAGPIEANALSRQRLRQGVAVAVLWQGPVILHPDRMLPHP